jgi:hypothetical protein
MYSFGAPAKIGSSASAITQAAFLRYAACVLAILLL